MREEETLIGVGDRIHVDKHRATVRFVGPVDGQSGLWVGLDWDDVSRGKHDGFALNKRYFQASHPTSGSLVRATKVNRGADLLAVITDRYGDDSEQEVMKWERVLEMNVGNATRYQRKIFYLKTVVLDSLYVNGPPPPDTPKFVNCTDLNLYNNLINSWADLFEILKFFPNLTELIISRNRLGDLPVDLLDHVVSAPITCLIANNCQLTSDTISSLMRIFPLVDSLHVCDNGLSSIHIEHAPLLKTIDLKKNPLRELSAIQGLAHLPSLEHVLLLSCSISSLSLDWQPLGFQHLTYINLKENAIKEWPCISALNRLPALVTLNIDYIMHTEKEMDVREVIIAKLPRLECVDGMPISEVERRSSEIRFLNKYTSLPAEARKMHEADLARLAKVHGPPVTDAKTGLKVVKLSLQLPNRPAVTRPFPLFLTVQKLAEMTSRQAGVPPSSLSIHLIQDDFEMPMDDPLRPISHYDPKDGDVLRITAVV